MKYLKIIITAIFILMISQITMAQSKTEKFNVAGECGSCKKKIEKAAMSAGASYALWNKETKLLTVSFDENSSKAKIEEAIAAAGYDTPDVKATNDAYKNLDDCCQYDRAEFASNISGGVKAPKAGKSAMKECAGTHGAEGCEHSKADKKKSKKA